MLAVVIPRFGGPEVLELRDLPDPQPAPGEILVRVAAATVNPTDLGLRAGVRRLPSGPPYIPGREMAGVVEAVGPGVVGRRVGDRVMGVVLPIRTLWGAQAERVAVPADSMAPLPEGLTPEQAATLPMNGLTARRALDLLALPPGATLAVTGAAGAVGGYAIELGKAGGLRVVGDADPGDAELVRGLGADLVVSRGEGVAAAIRAAVPAGVDALMDASAQGAVALPAVRDGGQLAAFRPFQGQSARGIRIQQVAVTDYARNGAALEELGRLASAGVLTPRVADTLLPARVAEAHRRLEAGGVRGRLVIVF